MCGRLVLPLALAAALIAGCASQAQLLDGLQAPAVQTAESRAQFDWNCPQATGQILSREMVQPVLQGPLVNGIQRAEYTVGVSGCGRRGTYVVVCPVGGGGCFAAGPGGFVRE